MTPRTFKMRGTIFLVCIGGLTIRAIAPESFSTIFSIYVTVLTAIVWSNCILMCRFTP